MQVEIREVPLSEVELAEYTAVPISFEVLSILQTDASADSLGCVEVPCDSPYRKDYDAEPGNHPTEWASRFDTAKWSAISVWIDDRRAGGLVMLQGDEKIDMLEGRKDLAVIWDLRVSPGLRGTGLGALLMARAEDSAKACGCRELKVETQNINVPACRFYESQGFELRRIDAHAYPGFPGEIQMLYYKTLS